MRNLFDEKQSRSCEVKNIASIISENLNSIKIEDQIINLRNNLVVKKICPDTYYLGISPILSSFLDAIKSITITEPKKDITAGQEIIQISGVWGSVNISAPMNFVIHDIIGNPAEGSFKSQWIAIIGTTDQEISDGKLYQTEWEKSRKNAVNLIEEIKLHSPQVGNTMMDGGTRIKYLHQLIGINRYLYILNSIISF